MRICAASSTSVRGLSNATPVSGPRCPAGLRQCAAAGSHPFEANIERTEVRRVKGWICRTRSVSQGVLQTAGRGDPQRGHRHDCGFGHRNSHAICTVPGCLSGAATPRLCREARQFLSALRARDVSVAAQLMRSHLESIPNRCWSETLRFYVASCCSGGNAAGDAPLTEDVRTGKTGIDQIIERKDISSYAKYEILKVEVADKVATVTLNRPQARNAVNQKLDSGIADDLGTISRRSRGQRHGADRSRRIFRRQRRREGDSRS